MFRVQDGFPFARVEAAKKLIISYKPWWSAMLNSMPVVPISVPVPEDGNYGGMTSTDREMHLYVDTNFATVAPLEILAGSIERELQRHIRDTWSRFSWLSPEEWDRQVNICIDLEISSSLKREYESGLDYRRNTNIFSNDMAEKWGVTTHPNLYGVGWYPEMLNLEDGKSAEEYYKLLNEPIINENDQDEEEETSSPDDELDNDEQESGDGIQQSPDGQGNQSDEDDSNSSQDNDESTSENSGSDSDIENEESSTENDSSSPEDANRESEDSENGLGNDSSGDSGELDSSNDSSSDEEDQNSLDGQQESSQDTENDGDSPVDGDSSDDSGPGDQTGDQSGEDSNEEGNGFGQEGESRDDEVGSPKSHGQGYQQETQGNDRFSGSGESGAESLSQDAVGNGIQSNLDSSSSGGSNSSGSQGDQPKDRMDMAESMMNQSPELSWMADDFQSPKETSTPSWEPDEQDQKPGVSETEQKELRSETAEKVKKHFPYGSKALKGMEEVANWAEKEKRKSPDHWANRLSRLGSLAADSAQIEGSGDLTYMKRNPNQPQIGAILMGMVDYAPTIYTLNDQSYSMVTNQGLLRSADMFLELTKSMFSRFGTTSLWIGVDTDIRYVGKPQSPNSIHKSQLPALHASGGTDFSHVIDHIHKGKLQFEGKKYKKPDLLVINTDCKFNWPDSWHARTRPLTNMKVIVCSVLPYKAIKGFLPSWINHKNNNFIEIDPR